MTTRVVLAVLNATFGIVTIRRYFKIARQRFAIDDGNMLVLRRYRDIDVLGNAPISTICVGIESHDTYVATIYRQVSFASFDTRYIEVSQYHEVSVSNVHKYRDTSIYRVSNRHYRACM